jgi:TRAP-type C4-dicarboxylate transport system substrate-binding protein
MTEADREAFRAAALAVQPFWRDSIASAADRAAQFCTEHGMQITETSFNAFREKMAPVYAEFKPKYPELFNMIMAQQ